METDHQNTFQPTENRYSSLGGEEFQPEKPDVTGKCLPKGFISTDNEPLKHFYLQMSRMMCPSVTADSTECEILQILYTRVELQAIKITRHPPVERYRSLPDQGLQLLSVHGFVGFPEGETAPEQYPLPSEYFYGKDFGAA